MTLRNRTSLPRSSGFTLVEVLVASTILLVILLLLVQTTDAVRRTWSRTTETVEQFREARDGFEAMTRRISQATLNTYWDYDDPTNPAKYLRQSELRYISGSMEDLAGSKNPKRPGHGIFFQAPVGFVVNQDYERMENLLNTWGFYVEWGSDKSTWPPFIQNLPNGPAEKWRFRLMELMEPSEDLSIYKYTSGLDKNDKPNNLTYKERTWFTDPLNSANPRRTRAIADNILYVTIRPFDQNFSKKTDLTKDFFYDSGPGGIGMDAESRWQSQLPQVLELSMMAVEENSFARVQDSDRAPTWMDRKWRSTNQNTVDADLQSIKDSLDNSNIKYRIFTTQVVIPGAKWVDWTPLGK